MAKAEYYRRSPVVEIQQTFYNLPRIQTAERWRNDDRVPGSASIHPDAGARGEPAPVFPFD